uniref:Uncharacterized protein n=1 Tax=Caulobacter sp. (strain K31) TaxID=366602 RepID=B0T7P9_CAUSK
MRRLALIPLAFSLAATGAAQAQSLESRLRSQLVTVNGRLQDLQNNQASLIAAKTTAEAERDALKRRLAAAEARARGARPASDGAELARYKALAEQADQARGQGETDLAAARAEIAQLTTQARQDRADRERSSAALAEAMAKSEAARAKNAQAIAVAKEILVAYERVTIADVIARREPFIGLKRVQIEKLEQDYGDRLYDSRLDVPPKPAAAPQAQ